MPTSHAEEFKLVCYIKVHTHAILIETKVSVWKHTFVVLPECIVHNAAWKVMYRQWSPTKQHHNHNALQQQTQQRCHTNQWPDNLSGARWQFSFKWALHLTSDNYWGISTLLSPTHHFLVPGSGPGPETSSSKSKCLFSMSRWSHSHSHFCHFNLHTSLSVWQLIWDQVAPTKVTLAPHITAAAPRLHCCETLSRWMWSNAAGALWAADSRGFNLNTYLVCSVCQ